MSDPRMRWMLTTRSGVNRCGEPLICDWKCAPRGESFRCFASEKT